MARIPPILFENIVIPLFNQVRNLGLIIDTGLTGDPQVSEVCRRVTNTLRALYRFKRFFPINTKTFLVQPLVFLVIDYADVCYSNISLVSYNNCIVLYYIVLIQYNTIVVSYCTVQFRLYFISVVSVLNV